MDSLAIAAESPGMVLERLLRERGLVKGAFAKRVGLDPSQLSKLFSGKRKFTRLIAVACAGELGVPVETFLPDEGEGA